MVPNFDHHPKNQDYKPETLGSIVGKILDCDMKSCNKNISKIRKVSFILQNFETKIKKRK